MSKQILVHTWYLEFSDDRSHKFYKAYITESGVCILRWGRIGADGQSNVHTFGTYEQAKALGLRQAYAKEAKGYVVKYADLIFSVNEDVLDQAQDGHWNPIDQAWSQATRGGEWDAAKTEVVGVYATFADRIKNLLDRAEGAEVETLLDEFSAADAVWDEINNKHDEVNAAMTLARATLMQKLVSG